MFESHRLSECHLSLNFYRKHFPRHLVLPVYGQPPLDIRMKKVCSFTTLNHLVVNSKPRISAWLFQKVPHSHIKSKVIYTIKSNFVDLLCSIQECFLQSPQTSHQCSSSSLGKRYICLHISTLMFTINFKATSMIFCYTLKLYSREPILSNSNTGTISSTPGSNNL